MAWTLRSLLKDWLTPGLVIVALAAGYRYVSIQEVKEEKKDAENKALQFENAKQRVKVIEWAESDYNQIAVYEEGKKVTKSLKLIDTIFKQRIEDDSLKKIREARIEISRASRDSSQKVQAQAMKRMDSINVIQTQTMQLILEKLDSIK